jgi:L-rhamnose isomerase
MKDKNIEKAYRLARERYASLGVSTEKAIGVLKKISISIQCWQGDDVTGFEDAGRALSGPCGIQVTGNYPGKARTPDELRMDLEKVFSLIPGSHRVNLHAMYGEFNGRTERNQINISHFKGWVSWAKQNKLKLDFNPTCFSHNKADSGFTLSSPDKEVKKFWIEHVKRCREIGNFIGKELKDPCIHNIWIPDGAKETPFNRGHHRELLKESLDEIFETEYPRKYLNDSLESKLFGIGSESYVVGSHEFYLAYAIANKKMLCLDLGHFHPTESIADKISAILLFSDEVLLHLSRGVRWDSDHVVILNDDVKSIAEEIVRNNLLNRVHLALDFFDAGINRIGAWVIGTQAVLKSFLIALLEPSRIMEKMEAGNNNFARMSLLEELKTLPFGSVWEYYCLKNNVPAGFTAVKEIKQYEKDTLSKR